MAESSGLMASLKQLASTLLAISQTRLELLANEMEEERFRVGQMLLYGGIALLFFGLTILLLTVFIVVAFWDSYRLMAVGGLAALYFTAGVLAMSALRTLARQRSKLFTASLAELARDRAQLASHHETPPR